MIRIGICDDSRTFLKEMESFIADWNENTQNIVTELFEDGDSLVQAHAKNPFDIILLDVVMPLFNGIDTAGELRAMDKNVKIVFITSSPEYAVDSYTVKASNYLLKPLDPSKLYACLGELFAEIKSSGRFISVKGSNALHRIQLDELAYIESQGKHICFMLTDGQCIQSTDPLYTYEDRLITEGHFFKCHRSYIVNLRHINKYTIKEITMHSGQIIPISRNCHKSFEAAYFSEVFKKAGEDK